MQMMYAALTFDRVSSMTNTVRTPNSFSLRIATSIGCVHICVHVVEKYIV